MASRWSTAFVEPPSASTTVIAFSNDSRVMIRRGVRFSSSNPRRRSPAASHSARFSGPTAGVEDEYGRLIPSASIALAMVFAVYIPPHAPAPGHARSTISRYSVSSSVPASLCPSASNAETTLSLRPRCLPDALAPPNTRSAGRSSRAIAIIAPGRFLSQPTTAITPS